MDLQLTAEQLEFKKLAREFLEAEVIPNRQEWDRQEEVDPAIVPKLGEIGFFGLTIPEEYGGLGGDWITYCIGMEELGRADSAVRGIVSVSMGLCGKIILVHGSEEQKQRWLPGIANGTKVGCFGLTEPDNGSDPGHLKTRAKRDGNEWVINGSKIFITNATIADVALVFARTGGEGARGISAFLVPTDTPGFERNLIHGKLGLRGQATAELSFNDVRVPADALVGEEGKGFKYAMESLDKGRISVAAGCVGIVQACLEACVDYAKSRAQFGKPIASYQLVQDMIAEISVDADAARLLAWRAADLVERGLPFGTAASKAKLFASEAAVKAANLAISRAVPSASRTALGAAAIAKRLTADGYRTKAGNPWSQAAVLVVLRNRTYLGEIWFRDRWYKAEDHHPAIISEKLFDQAQDILDARGDATTHRAVANSDYYLAGRLFCSHCGKRYLGTAANGNKYRYRYYTCFTRHRYGTEHCSADRLPADQLEHAVLTSLLDTLTRSDLIEQSLANTTSEVDDQRATYTAELAALEREITKNEDAIDRYLTAFENGTMDEETCSPRVKKLATQLTEQRARRDELGLLIDEAATPEMPDTTALETLRADVEAAADAGSDEALRRVMQTFVHRVDITSRETAAPTFIIPGDANVPTQRSAAASPGSTTERKVRTLHGSVPPAGLEPAT